MSAITVYITIPFEAIQIQPLMTEEDEALVRQWFIAIDFPSVQHHWAVRNPNTGQVALVPPSEFLIFETAQQWENSAKATVDAIRAEVESWPEDAFQREFILHIIEKRSS
mgnify:CR=1 FL=1